MNTDFPTPRHSDMMIKVCGMRDPHNVADVAALAPMLMGFIFHESSPRDVTGILSPDTIKSLPPYVRPVAVFVDKDIHFIMDVTRRYGFRIVQLHGEESPLLCRALRDNGLVVLKAIDIGDNVDWAEYMPYGDCVDMFVMDTRCSCTGGSGRKFNWDLLENYNLPVPYLLSGGIGPEDIPLILEAMRPGMAGIDINSRFEAQPGLKDMHLLINFIISLRKFNEDEPTSIPFWEKTK